MMYFQELKNLKVSLSKSINYKKHELKVINSAIDSLDFWLITRSLRARNRLNPLQFADEAEISWNVAAQLFDMLEKQDFFSITYEYWSEDRMECLIRTDDVEKIRNKKQLYNSLTDDFEEVDIEFVEVWYKLLESPLIPYSVNKENKKKTYPQVYALSSVKNNEQVSAMLEKIILREGVD